jgi:predicted DNA-binding protein with PD1-like motif
MTSCTGGSPPPSAAVVGLRDGSTRGGHLKGAYVFPTLEVIIAETPSYLQWHHDPETGRTLIDLEASEG